MHLQDLTDKIKAKQKEFNISNENIAHRLGYSGREAWAYKCKNNKWWVRDIWALSELFKMKPKDFFNDGK